MAVKLNLLGNILIVLTLIIVVKMYYESSSYQLKCITSNVDGGTYCVRDGNRIQMAADLLAETSQKMKKLVKYMGEKYPERDNVIRLVNGFNPKKISETLPSDTLTAYSENKGEKLAFCVKKTKDGKQLIDENTLTFVAIHELSHIMTKSVGHGDEFWQNFKFLLINAKANGIHEPVDYKKNPINYCDMEIHDNPYFDL
jgi:hypothetical protein